MHANHHSIVLSVLMILITSGLVACEPGGVDKHSKHGGSGGKGYGAFVPGPVAQMPAAPNPAVFAAYSQHRQMLAAQAAAYREARKPLKLAKAYQLRQTKLAARESRRAWVLAKQEEWKRSQQKEGVEPAASQSSPVLFAMTSER